MIQATLTLSIFNLEISTRFFQDKMIMQIENKLHPPHDPKRLNDVKVNFFLVDKMEQ